MTEGLRDVTLVHSTLHQAAVEAFGGGASVDYTFHGHATCKVVHIILFTVLLAKTRVYVHHDVFVFEITEAQIFCSIAWNIVVYCWFERHGQ